MPRPSLRHGYTTGACAAAAALGAALMLRDQRPVDEVELELPAGFAATFRLAGQGFDGQRAHCFVVKDAGDDPDVTHGVEVHAEVRFGSSSPQPSPPGGEGEETPEIVIQGGTGIGRVTKPGLAVPVGEWAINPVPRRMIREAVEKVFTDFALRLTLHVTISIPDGLERSRRTLNERLGIVGGLSILGTTGVVRPISHKAWTDTLEVALDVALAAGCRMVVLSTGRTSELAAQQRLQLPEEAFVMMGDHVGYALEACHRRGFAQLVLSAQFAKLVKIACGHPQTHVSSSSLDLRYLAGWARAVGLDEAAAKTIECANTAREVFERLEQYPGLVEEVARQALLRCGERAPGAALSIMLVGYDARPAGLFGDWPGAPAGEGKG
ncbi:cobalt-precorrin-5B C(1)-methyltransferase [Desulfuromonas versatilis]|uniref:Cobalt-precorrin-5B C(1)-methyltransferase n=1 Tax=Desulfuromonas versatilis TaxID=2802975 RepID=A0ABM8HSY4_9BACT|nr:cobalt-precorrin-5B (C(1))-methyltransferase CbiD [Desulfuromonas versatilis]BCR03743.1 cobalt-precorrin-5B C(1)-methyltransferase [Desulfuromonas versatilis]